MRKITSRMVAGFAAFLLTTAGFATSLAPANLAKLVEKAEKVFAGTVQSVEVVETQQGWAEKVTVAVSEAIAGPVSAGDTVVWLQARNGKDMRLPSMPEYKTGEEHMVFLSAKAQGSEFQSPMALSQGSFRVHVNKATGEKLVRNEHQNRNLFSGLDTASVAAAMVEEESKGKGLSVAEKRARAQKRGASLGGGRAGALRLDDMKLAVKAMKTGGKPSDTFKGTKQAQVLQQPVR